MTILLPNPSRTAAAKTTIRMRKPHQITQALIDWHLTTHTGTFTDCQEDVCVLVDDHRHTHHCTCTAVKGGPAGALQQGPVGPAAKEGLASELTSDCWP